MQKNRATAAHLGRRHSLITAGSCRLMRTLPCGAGPTERSVAVLSSNPNPEPGVSPLMPLEQPAHWLLGTTMHVALGLALGMTAARLLRSRHLHWSWATAALVPPVLVYPALGT